MSFLDLALESLLFTNLWIILYTKLLPFLASRFPAQINDSFLWVQPAPEPFEIPLYLILTMFFLLILFIFHKLNNQVIPIPTYLKVTLLLILSLLFIYFLGRYPMSQEFDPYPPRADKTIYTIIPSVYLMTVLLILFFNKTLMSFWQTRVTNIFFSGFLILLLAFVTFDARFPMAGHDYEYFLGPAWEVINGKTVYTEVLSRYAFLTIDILALLHKTKILSLFYLPFIVWLLYTTLYFSVFFLIKQVSGSSVFSLLGLVSIMTVNYFSLSHLPSTIPQIGPLRWFPMIFLLLLLYKTKKINSIAFMVTLSFLSLFMIDVGIAMILSFFASLGFLFLVSQINLLETVKSILRFLIIFFAFILIVNAVHILFDYKFVDIFSIVYSFRKHAVLGLSLMPIQMRNHFWIVLLIYFASIIYFFRRNLKSGWQSRKGSRQRAEFFQPAAGSSTGGKAIVPSENRGKTTDRIHFEYLLLFSANLSLFASIYYVGRSHPHNLFNISLFPLLNLFFLIGIFYLKINSKRAKIITLTVLFLILVVYPAYQRRYTLSEMLISKFERLKNGNLFKSEVDEIISQSYKDEIKLIKKSLPFAEIAILSVDDSYFFLKTGKKDLLDANPIMGIDLPEDLDFALKNVVKKCPKKIALDCSFVDKCSPYTPFIGVNFNIRLILNKIEDVCQVKYEPTICTNKLCIAEKNK